MPAATVTTVPTRDGRVVSLRRWPGTGRPLVLLHGLLDSSEGWTWLAEHSPRPCVAIDLPGFGGSDRAPEPRVAAFAADVADALDALEITRCSLIGHSLGGAVAAEVAERSDRVASLALLAPIGFGAVRLAEAFTLPVVRDVATLALPLVFANPLLLTAAYAAFVANGRPPERELVQRLVLRGGCAPAAVRDATIAIADAGRCADALFRRRLTFAGPVDALWGDADVLVDPSHAQALRRALPDAAVHVWSGMGHHPQRERPRELTELLTDTRRAWTPRRPGAAPAPPRTAFAQETRRAGPGIGLASRRMRSLLVVSAVLVLLALQAVPASAQERTTPLAVEGRGLVEVRPDRVEVRYVLNRVAGSREAARASAASRSRRLIGRLRRIGIAEADIRLSRVNVGRRSSTRSLRRPFRAIGVVAARSSTVTLAGRMLDVGTTLGADVRGPDYDLVDDLAARAAATTRAVDSARRRAEAVARGLNQRIVGLRSVSLDGAEITSPSNAQADQLGQVGQSEAVSPGRRSGPSTPTAPGRITVTARVTVNFELAP